MLPWTQILQHKRLLEHVGHCYDFPIEVRQYLHDWLEKQPWQWLDPDNATHEPMAAELLQTLITKLRGKIQELNGGNFGLQKKRLEQACSQFQSYQSNSLQFLRMMKNSLEQETALLQSMLAQEDGSMDTEVTAYSPVSAISREQCLTEKLQELQATKQMMVMKHQAMQSTEELVSCFHQSQTVSEKLQEMYSKSEALQAQLQNPSFAHDQADMHKQLFAEWQLTQTTQKELETAKNSYEAHLASQRKLRMELAELYSSTVPLLEQLHKQLVDDEMVSWKRRQQVGCNGNPSPASELDKLQYGYECLAEVLLTMKQQILRLEPPHMLINKMVSIVPEFLMQYHDTVHRLLLSLFASAFVVEQQPSQVVLQNSFFKASVRLLIAKKLNLPLVHRKVKASILSEEEAKKWTRDRSQIGSQTNDMSLNNNEVALEYPETDPSSPQTPTILRAQFRMQLTGSKGKNRRGQDRVTKIKFCFRFQTSLNVEGTELDLQVLSLPVVITVHGSQKCQAIATILWDNAFSHPRREPFDVPSSMPWSALVEQLQLTSDQLTGQRLTPEHISFLACKIFGQQGGFSQNTEVSLAQFCEKPLPDHPCQKREKKKGKRRCTFWDWFYDALILIHKHLKGPWENGYIMGFMNKVQAQEALSCQDIGTFLFRFSDSECGALSIAFVEEKNGNHVVAHTEPMDSCDLETKPLADRIRPPNKLVTLYPNIPKDTAFSQYYTPEKEPDPRRSYCPLGYAVEVTSILGAENCPSPGMPSPRPTLPEDLATVDMKDAWCLFRTPPEN